MPSIELIVIGGSAGALDALLTIIPALPTQLSCPIVVVLHIPPARPSLLSKVLARASTRAVCEAEDKAPLLDHTLYVAPPNYHVLIERDHSMSLSIDETVHHSRPSIDVLFESAAHAYGPAVAGVVLSGANADGAEGLRQICQAGGVAIVQAPATASSPLMPESAARRVGPSAHVIPLPQLGAFLATVVGGTSPTRSLR